MEYIILVLGYVPAILYYIMKGNSAMEWSLELVISIGIPVLSILGSVFASTRSGNGKVISAQKDLSKEHLDLSKEHLNLTKEHSELKAEIKADIVQTQTKITTAQNCLAGKIDTLDRVINNEIIRKETLSPDQSRIDTAVDIIKAGWSNIIRENQELRDKVDLLTQENKALKTENDELRNELDELRSDEHGLE